MIKFNKGGLEDSEVYRVRRAIKIVSEMWMNPMGGFTEDGKDYQYIDFVHDKRDCLAALEVLKEFVEAFAPIFHWEDDDVNENA